MLFFHVSQGTRPWKTTKSSKFLGFSKILGKIRPILGKNGSRNFKSRYLRNTFLLSTFAVVELWSWNLAKLENKWIQKDCIIVIFEFLSDTLTPPNMLKNHFGLKYMKIILTHFEHYFILENSQKRAIFAIPGRTWVRISQEWSEILTFRKKRRNRIKNTFT